MIHAADAAVHPFVFEGLPSYSRSEAALSNWASRFFRSAVEWKTWIHDAWGDLLLEPAGLELTLTQSNSVEPQAPTRSYSFRQKEVLIGREPGSDVVLETLAAGKRHARLVVDRGRCFLEDLGSSLGTYCNQARVPANQRRLLERGDAVSVFPYVFTVAMRQLWARQQDVGVYAGQADSMSWRAFQDSAARARTNFAIRIHPTGAWIFLEVSRSFLSELADRVLRPLEIDNPSPAVDDSILEFLILCLAERVNRDLKFPFQLEIVPDPPAGRMQPEQRGVALASSVSLLTATGALRVFLPYDSLQAMSATAVQLHPSPPASISWRFPVTLGTVDLTAAELSGLERNDVLIPARRLELLLPNRFDRGWTAHPTDSSAEIFPVPRNLNRLLIEKYFEREPLNHPDAPAEVPPESNAASALDELPVRLHVIVAEKELSLSEAAQLTKGSIVELDRDPAAPVTLVVNGRVLGEGQLVDVEGRLGVRILSWRGA